MRRDIEFNAEGSTLRGWFYVPDGAKKPVPTIVMAHGFSRTKEKLPPAATTPASNARRGPAKPTR